MFAFANALFTVMMSTSSSSTRRILITRSSMSGPHVLGPAEPERRARIGLGLEPRATTSRFDDLADDGEADTGALDLIASLERREQRPDPLVKLGSDTNPIVA